MPLLTHLIEPMEKTHRVRIFAALRTAENNEIDATTVLMFLHFFWSLQCINTPIGDLPCLLVLSARISSTLSNAAQLDP